jgi:predicted homoserine dehydrogenase-like protein
VVEGDDPDKLGQAVADGRPVGVTDARMLIDLPVDVVVDATGVPDVGALLSYAALTGGKDVATLNAEADVTIGLLLARVAKASGQVYAVCKGDEPVEVKELFDFVTDLGFEVVCAGKGKNNPLRPHDTPDSVADEAAAKHMNPKMLASFVDGTKTMIECACMANGTGLELRPTAGSSTAPGWSTTPPAPSPPGCSWSAAATTPPSSRRWRTCRWATAPTTASTGRITWPASRPR